MNVNALVKGYPFFLKISTYGKTKHSTINPLQGTFMTMRQEILQRKFSNYFNVNMI